GFAGLLNSPPGLQPPYSAPWPMFRGLPAAPGGGGPPVAPCDNFAADSMERLACDIDTLRTDPPCQLPTRSSRQLQRASAFLMQAASQQSARPMRRFLRRGTAALKKALRAGVKRQVPCQDDLQADVGTLVQRMLAFVPVL